MNPGWQWAHVFEDLYGQPNPLAAALERAQRIFRESTADLILFAAGRRASDRYGPDAPRRPIRFARPAFDRDVHGWRLGEGAGAVVLMPYAQARRAGRRVYAVIQALAGGAW